MRAERLVGLSALWLGVVSVVDFLLTDGFATSLGSLAYLFATGLVAIAGVGFLLGLEEIPEDTGERILPPQLVWYVAAAGFAVLAALRTAELLGGIG